MKMEQIILGVIAAIVLLPALGMATAAGGGGGVVIDNSVATLSYLGQSGLPRGMRNNNPGNIRKGATKWQGKIPLSENTDGAFEQFVAYVWGIRAMIKNLQSYQRDRGLNTLAEIISTWAPSADNNDTAAYISAVSMTTAIPPNVYLNLKDADTMRPIIKAMTRVENGRDAVTDAQFNYAWSIV